MAVSHNPPDPTRCFSKGKASFLSSLEYPNGHINKNHLLRRDSTLRIDYCPADKTCFASTDDAKNAYAKTENCQCKPSLAGTDGKLVCDVTFSGTATKTTSRTLTTITNENKAYTTVRFVFQYLGLNNRRESWVLNSGYPTP